MQLIDNIPVWGSPVDEGALRQIKTCARTADRVALMADHHLGYAVPIGGVVAYSDKISPSGVGYDIACGNKAVLTDADAGEVRRNIAAIAPLKEMARQQLGTVGSGNHYVDIFEDEQGRVWIGVHFGSRGLGHKIATWFLKKAGAKDGMDVDPCVIDANGDLGDQYIKCMKLGGEYAYA